jgi:hypothetical protein
MFCSPLISALMKWHAKNQSDRQGGDGLVRHPYNSKAWKHFHENVDPTFQRDARNVHFALAADGVNPFKQTRSTWSTWPVVLLNYNLPPWLSTKKFFMMLCLLIPGKQLVTSECFDVYMEPFIEELLELWSSIPAFDITEEEGLHNFTLRAMLIWTIHDFPGYGIVGGFAHQGLAACLWCGEALGKEHSIELDKQTYGGCRRWLPMNHIFRSDDVKDYFNGQIENREMPGRVSVEEQVRYGEEYVAWKAAGNRDGGAGDPSKKHGEKRNSILFQLPYWKVIISIATGLIFAKDMKYKSYSSCS